MNESGITSQYGFLFQRKVFVLYVLENMNVKQRFCFEGKDDVEIAADEMIKCILDDYARDSYFCLVLYRVVL